jgi:hypothetical protein
MLMGLMTLRSGPGSRRKGAIMARKRAAILLGVVTLVLGAASAALAAPPGGDTKVTVGSPRTMFPRNNQNEPGLAAALNASRPTVLAAGANEESDLEPCPRTPPEPPEIRCPFTPGVGVSGIYFSFDGGRSWTQPTYTGWTARNGTPHVGPIETLPWYDEAGLVSGGDPSLAFGPRPGRHGFSWANGARLYYANLAANFPGRQTFNAQEAIAVSRTDDPAAAAAGVKRAWMRPVIASRQLNANIFSANDNIWADNAASSRFFGNVYVCWTRFVGPSFTSSPIVIARSTDGGSSWSNPLKLSRSAATFLTGVQGCTIRTDSRGTVYVFWMDMQTARRGQQFMTRSFDGGRSFEPGRPVADIVEVGKIDPVQGLFTFDGVAGARTWDVPSVDVANGAPSGRDATDELVLAWSDGRRGLNREQALVQTSTTRGRTWSAPVNAAQSGDRPDFTAVAISPNGTDVYLTYDAFLTPWRPTTSSSRLMQGVVRHADVGTGGSLGGFATLHRGSVGDARASSANSLGTELIGDYNDAAATRTFGAALWNDARDAAVCPAVNRYRQSLLTDHPLRAPWPLGACPPTFGNTDIFGGSYADPTP